MVLFIVTTHHIKKKNNKINKKNKKSKQKTFVGENHCDVSKRV